MMLPARRSFMPGSTLFTVRKVAVRLPSTDARQPSSLVSSSGPGGVKLPPALATSHATLPSILFMPTPSSSATFVRNTAGQPETRRRPRSPSRITACGMKTLSGRDRPVQNGVGHSRAEGARHQARVEGQWLDGIDTGMQRADQELEEWLGGRDSNPDNLLQRQMSYRWTTSQCQSLRSDVANCRL